VSDVRAELQRRIRATSALIAECERIASTNLSPSRLVTARSLKKLLRRQQAELDAPQDGAK
jgi:hypothetical protein